MKLYVLCSYDPDVSTDYQELYEKMEKSYRMTLDHVSQTEEEQENTYLSGYSARAVIYMVTGWNGPLQSWKFQFPPIINPKAQMYS